jgi:hypothetical protein
MKSNEKRKRIPYMRPPGIENAQDGVFSSDVNMTPEQREAIRKEAEDSIVVSERIKTKELEDEVKQWFYEATRPGPNFIDLSISEEDNIMKSLRAGGMD